MRNKIRLLFIVLVVSFLIICILFLLLLNRTFKKYDIVEYNNNQIDETPTTSISANGTIWRDVKENAALSMKIIDDIGIIICNALSGEWDDLPLTDHFKEIFKEPARNYCIEHHQKIVSDNCKVTINAKNKEEKHE